MKKLSFILTLATGSLLSFAAPAEEINCTASPSCDTLGYTQTDCPKGGIRCPFDKSKMFCVSGFGGEDFSFKNAIYQYQVVFSDGTTGTFYNADKDAIGIVTYVHPNTEGNHGIIMALNQPTVQTRANAIKYCANYVTKGTKVGDWHLADLGEMMTMQNGDLIDDTKQFSTLNEMLKTIPGAQALGVSFSYYYSQKCSNNSSNPSYLWVDCDISNLTCPTDDSYDFDNASRKYPQQYLNMGTIYSNWFSPNSRNYNPAPGCANSNAASYYYIRGGYPFYYSSSYWTISDAQNLTQPYAVDLYADSRISNTGAQRGHFRCMAIF